MTNTTRSDANTLSILIHEKNKYQTIFNSLRSPAAVLDRNGRIDIVNPAWTDLFGNPPAAGCPSAPQTLADGPTACLAPVVDRFVASGAADITVEQPVETTAGTRHLVMRVRRMHDDDDRFSGCVVILEDVTSEKQAAAAACDSERLQGALALAGAVCHDLNQPLMAISGYAELLMMDCSEDTPHFGKLKKLAAQVEKVGGITRKLMHVTRYETKAYLDKQIIDIEKASESV